MNVLLLVAIHVPVAAPPQESDRFARWERDVAAIEKRLAARPPKPGAVFFAGSSTIVRWDLKASFPDLDAVNVGFGGSEIRDSTHFAGRIITPHHPAALVFYAGDNDLNAGRTPAQLADDFKEFCAAVHKDAPKCRVLFASVKPSLARWKQFDTQTKANTLIREFCRTDERLVYIDVVPLMLGSDGKPIPELYVKDGLHLSPAGYEKWVPEVKKALGK
ncbi:MAG TPA: GDSL-type esterase/lipase family protein [Gemmataceae bacterium]|nr:GDSL-type esterase/lipase family protein [Gemmataceae bacterium]